MIRVLLFMNHILPNWKVSFHSKAITFQAQSQNLKNSVIGDFRNLMHGQFRKGKRNHRSKENFLLTQTSLKSAAAGNSKESFHLDCKLISCASI